MAFDGLSLYFQGWQTEQNQKGVICLVHGLGEHSGRYEHWSSLLNQDGYSVLTPDLRSHGKFGGMRGHISSFTDYVNDTDLLLKEAEDRFPGSPNFLYRHSIGAVITSNYVLCRKPQLAGVILTGYASKTAVQEQKEKVLLAKVLGSLAPKVTIPSGLDPSTISRDPEIVSLYINDPLVHDKVSLGFGKGMMDGINWDDQHASEWTLPVLIMHGEKDGLSYDEGSREFASKIRGDCTLKIWPSLSHEVHNEPEKEEVFEFLHQWLDNHLIS
jgi:acylglycerol lipase